MGRIRSGFFMSLDGVVESPEHWQFPYYNHEVGAAVAWSTRCEAFLMGRALYELWVEYWPFQDRMEPAGVRGDADKFASFINQVPKYVVSNTLTDPTWNNTTVVPGDAAAGVRDLKDRIDGDIAMSGSATLVRSLLAEGLLDEIHLMIHPVVVGRGQRLFDDGEQHHLGLVRHNVFETGVVSLTYAPVRAPGEGAGR